MRVGRSADDFEPAFGELDDPLLGSVDEREEQILDAALGQVAMPGRMKRNGICDAGSWLMKRALETDLPTVCTPPIAVTE